MRSWNATFKHRLRSGCRTPLRIDFDMPLKNVFRVTDYTAISSGHTITVTTSGGATTRTAVTDWAIGATNAATASNIATDLNTTTAREYASFEAVGDLVYVYSRRGNTALTLAESSAGITLPLGATTTAETISWTSDTEHIDGRPMVIQDSDPIEFTIDPITREPSGIDTSMLIEVNAHTDAVMKQASLAKLPVTVYLGAWWGSDAVQTGGATILWEPITVMFLRAHPERAKDYPRTSYEMRLTSALGVLDDGELEMPEFVGMHPFGIIDYCVTESDLGSTYFNSSSFAESVDTTRSHFVVSRWTPYESEFDELTQSFERETQPYGGIVKAMVKHMGGTMFVNASGQLDYKNYSRTAVRDFLVEPLEYGEIEPQEGPGAINEFTVKYCQNATGVGTSYEFILRSDVGIREIGATLAGSMDLEWCNGASLGSYNCEGPTNSAFFAWKNWLAWDSTHFGIAGASRTGFCGSRFTFDGTGPSMDVNTWANATADCDIDPAAGRVGILELVARTPKELKAQRPRSDFLIDHINTCWREVIAIDRMTTQTTQPRGTRSPGVPYDYQHGRDDQRVGRKHIQKFTVATGATKDPLILTLPIKYPAAGAQETVYAYAQARIYSSYNSEGFTNGRVGFETGLTTPETLNGSIPYVWQLQDFRFDDPIEYPEDEAKGKYPVFYDATIPYYRAKDVLQRFEFAGPAIRIPLPLHYGEAEIGDVFAGTFEEVTIGRRGTVDENVNWEVTTVSIDVLGDSPGVYITGTYLRDDGPIPPPVTVTFTNIDPVTPVGSGVVAVLDPLTYTTGEPVTTQAGQYYYA